MMALIDSNNFYVSAERAMAAVDHINKLQGRNTIVHGAMGFDKKWSMRQEFLSRRYTTRIEDVIVVKAS